MEKIKVIRCGIIPYHKINDDHFIFLMGLKRNYKKYYGDFGGGIKKNEHYMNGLIRELEEESNGIFGDEYLFVQRMLNDLNTREITYLTKSKTPAMYLEYLVYVDHDDYPRKYIEAGNNNEHLFLQWLNVVRDENGEFRFLGNTGQYIDGSLKPLMKDILETLNTL